MKNEVEVTKVEWNEEKVMGKDQQETGMGLHAGEKEKWDVSLDTV